MFIRNIHKKLFVPSDFELRDYSIDNRGTFLQSLSWDRIINLSQWFLKWNMDHMVRY